MKKNQNKTQDKTKQGKAGSRNVWKDALDQLDPKDKKIINKYVTKPGSKGSKPSNGKGGSKSKSSAHNDVAWYKGYEALINQASKISFNNIPNQAEILGPEIEVNATGTVSVDLFQCPGKARNWDDAINLAMKALWLDMHRKYRGLGSYESSDLGMAMFCIADFFAQIAEAERLYGSYVKFNVLNRNQPSTIIMAQKGPLNVNGSDLANFRHDLNLIIAAAHTLCIPKGVSIFSAIIDRVSGVYKDNESAKSSTYLFRYPYYTEYDATSITTGTSVQYVPKTYQSYSNDLGDYECETLDDIITRLKDQLQILLTDSDIQRMCSDLLACYGNNEVTMLHELSEDFAIDLVDFSEIKLQFHNMVMVGNLIRNAAVPKSLEASVGYAPRIYQLDNVIHSDFTGYNTQYNNGGWYENNDPTLGVPVGYYLTIGLSDPVLAPYLKNGALLDAWDKEQPSDDTIIEMTRLVTQTTLAYDEGSSTFFSYTIHSMFIPMTMSVYTLPTNAIKNNYKYHFIQSTNVVAGLDYTDGQEEYKAVRRLCHDSRYDWFPFMYILNPTLTYEQYWSLAIPAPQRVGVKVSDLFSLRIKFEILGDVINIKCIDKDSLRRLHAACDMGLWKVQIDTFSVKE